MNDDNVLNKELDSVGGSISRGEFGSLLREVFDPVTKAEFHWLRWGTLNGRLCHVFTYHVEQERSRWTVQYQNVDRTTPGYRGLIYVDLSRMVVLRITLEAIMPPSFPIQEVRTQLDYRDVVVSGETFLLPTISETRMRVDHTATLNQIEFSSYRRYSSDTSITFDLDSGPTSPDQEETPVSKPPTVPPGKPPVKP